MWAVALSRSVRTIQDSIVVQFKCVLKKAYVCENKWFFMIEQEVSEGFSREQFQSH